MGVGSGNQTLGHVTPGVPVAYRGVPLAGLVGIGGETCTKGLEAALSLEVGPWLPDMVAERVGKDMWASGRGGNSPSPPGHPSPRDRPFQAAPRLGKGPGY